MPIYEYTCRSCRGRFEALVGPREAAECPSCRSRDLERLLSPFSVGAAGHEDAMSCGTCGDPRGPGACGLD